MEKVISECKAKQGVEEISDACARVLASQYYEGQASLGYSFVSSGSIPEDTSDLWRELFGSVYETSSPDEKIAMDMMGTYLIQNGPREPVPGWSSLWL